MTCRHVNELRDAYLDGDLSPSLTAEVHAHLLQCPACQQQFEMMRACGDLIARDESEPVLDTGFASRVVASLPKKSAPAPDLMTRRDVRQRFFRIFAGAGLPAAAAMLFLSVLIWPTSQDGIVLDETMKASDVTAPDVTTPVAGIVSPTIDTVRDTRETIRGVTDAFTKTVDNVPELQPMEESSAPSTSQPSLLDAFLSPFKDALTPVPAASDKESDKEIVRF